MKTLSFLMLILFGGPCFAVGWHEITKENIGRSKIKLTFEEKYNNGCHRVNVLLPEIFVFEAIGKRIFSGVSLKKIVNKDKGWQITGKGSTIGLPTIRKGDKHEIPYLCLSKEDLKVISLSVWYETPQGSPPVVVIISQARYCASLCCFLA